MEKECKRSGKDTGSAGIPAQKTGKTDTAEIPDQVRYDRREKRRYEREKANKEPKKRLSVLEQYYRLGWLSKARHKWSAEDRLKAGQTLYSDFYRSHRVSGCIDYEKPRVDNSIKSGMSEEAAEAHIRFSAAFKAIPVEFRSAVYSVCCDDKVLPEPQGMGGRRKIAHKTEQAVLLCLGLDKLIWHYLGKR